METATAAGRRASATLVQVALQVVAGQRVVLIRLQGLALGPQLAHQVAVAHRPFVDDLLWAAGRAQQVSDDRSLQLSAQVMG
jgi:hypothetical protein